MEVILLETSTQSVIKGQLKPAKIEDMRTIADGWKFNWRKHFYLPNAKAFKVYTGKNSNEIEGLMIYQNLKSGQPYMAYLECGRYNKGKKKKYDHVAGCLIAKACQLSSIEGKDLHKGYLSFKCMDEKVISLYHNKYGAVRVDEHWMYIDPKTGNELVEKYLLNNN